MIQGGCPIGSGTGGPGYAFDDEISPDKDFTKPYMLAMANAGKRDGQGHQRLAVLHHRRPHPGCRASTRSSARSPTARAARSSTRSRPCRTGAHGQAASRPSSSSRSSVHDVTPDHAPTGSEARTTQRGRRMTEPMARSSRRPGLPAPPRPGVLRALPALRPADLPRVPAAGRGRRPVRRLRPRAARRAVRTARTVFGGRVTDGRPVVTLRHHRDLRGGLARRSRSSPGADRAAVVRAVPGAGRAVALPHRGVRARPEQLAAHPVQHVRAVA